MKFLSSTPLTMLVPMLWLAAMDTTQVVAQKVVSPIASSTSTTSHSVAFAQSLVRVTATTQPYDFTRPWSKRAPQSRRALGAVLKDNLVLVTAECVANATYIELETPDGERKQPASVECVDYEADLALLRPESADFLKDFHGLDFTTPHVGDSLAVLQLEANGNLLSSRGQMTTAEVVRYPIDDTALLVGRLNVSLQVRETVLSLPLLKDGALAGLMLRYEQQSGLLDFIPATVIEHFITDSIKKPYEGFPRMGCSFAVTRDPQLRRFLELNAIKGGVLITQILKDGPAEKAGLKKGDVLLEIAGNPIDSDGNYRDPDYGRISLGHLVSTKHFEGQLVKIRISRDGKLLDLSVPVARRHPEQYLSEPYIIDRAPRYYVLGGLVLEELSRQYLKEFGADWLHKAPLELVNLDRTQGENAEEKRTRIVILTRVLPSDLTVGYEDLRHQVVTAINGQPLSSLDDVPKALEKALDGLHKVELVGDPSVVFLDAKGVQSIGAELQKSYGLPALNRLQ
jgi:S1-C subfamily serine protease